MASFARTGANGLVAAALLSCGPVRPAAPVEPAPPGKPALLLFITVDQLTPVYFDRFRPQFTGGLARLLDSGAVFVDAHQDHAITETAPGHASTMSGRFPRSTGITRNLLGVNDNDAPLIGAPDPGASPRRFRGTTLTDWMIARNPATRVLSVSIKDRAAILPIGRSRQQVFWYSLTGMFTTSRWYADSLPTWVKTFNTRLPQDYMGKTWDLLVDPSMYPEPDSVPVENGGRDFLFPHRFGTDTSVLAGYVRLFPLMDELTLQFALAGVRALDLGRGPDTDVLAVSLSGTDLVGHLFGPDSREQHDQILRLDRSLGAFLDSLTRMRGGGRIIVALTADHGVAPMPELAGNRFAEPPRRVKIGPAFAPVVSAIRAGGGDPRALDLESGALFVDSTRLGRMSVDEVVRLLQTSARQVPGVWRVDRFADLAGRDPDRDPIARRWLHMFPDDILPAAVITLTPGSMFDFPIGATHGTPHDHDTHVPIIFFGAPFKPGRYDGFVRTVDIAPTLAEVLGVTPTERLDGRPLVRAIASEVVH